MAEIDLDKINAEVEGLSLDDLKKQLLDAKVRQMVATKTYYNPERAKVQRQRRAAKIQAMFDKAKELGIYDQLMAEARDLADEKIAEKEDEAA